MALGILPSHILKRNSSRFIKYVDPFTSSVPDDTLIDNLFRLSPTVHFLEASIK